MGEFRTLSVALLVGAMGGGVFIILELPLPWMLGALCFSAIAAVFGPRIHVPSPAANAARGAIGIMAGSAFSPDVVGSMVHWWPSLLAILAFTLGAVVIGFLYFRRIAGFDPVTAFFASAPGGLAELTTLGGSYGGNLRELVLVHSIRIICVLVFLPILLPIIGGYDLSSDLAIPETASASGEGAVDWFILFACWALALGLHRRVRVPGGVLIPALLFSSVIHGAGWSDASLPAWLVASVQVVIGTAVGSRFFGITRSEASGAVLQGLVWASILIVVSSLMAMVCRDVLDEPVGALLLAFSPGGTAEMTILALAAEIEVAFVVTCQITRVMFVYTITPFLFYLFRLRGLIPPGQSHDGTHDG